MIRFERNSVEREPTACKNYLLQARLAKHEGREGELPYFRQKRFRIEMQRGLAGAFGVWTMREMSARPSRLPIKQRLIALQATKGSE